jgi:glycosyl hydrolase family 113
MGKSRWALLLVLAGIFIVLGIVRRVPWGPLATPPMAVSAGKSALRGAGLKRAEPNSYPRLFFQKGVNFTAEYPDIYGSKGADERLSELKKYGVNAIALVPYGFASEKPVRIRFNLGWEKDSGVERLAEIAHGAGMRVLLKPQLFVREGYPGSLEYSAAGERKEWFAQYRIFLEHYAMLAERIHADVFCVGVELDKLSKYNSEWRVLIARARELYPGPLVYAANFGEEFESVRFWDALDYVGMDEYYSLPDSLSTDELVAKVETVQKRVRRPVIFTEAGFPSVEGGNQNPWDERPRGLSLELQARCYEQIFRAFYDKPWFQGMYWWKVGTNGFGGAKDGSHTPWGKPAMEVVGRWYRKSER